MREALDAAGAGDRRLPPCSPNLNPIGPAWSKPKAALRRAEARSLDQPDAELPHALGTITATDTQGWFHHAGHRLN